jgi:hypothetical protein
MQINEKFLKLALSLFTLIILLFLAIGFFIYQGLFSVFLGDLGLWHAKQKLENSVLPENSQIFFSDSYTSCGSGHDAQCGGHLTLVIESPLEPEAFFQEMEALNEERFENLFTLPCYYYYFEERQDTNEEYAYYFYHEIISNSEVVQMGSAGDLGTGYEYGKTLSIKSAFNYDVVDELNIPFKENIHYYVIEGGVLTYTFPD